MRLKHKRFLALGFFASVLFACQAPPAPPEVEEAKKLESELWRAGAPFYLKDDYQSFLEAFKRAQDHFQKENLKLGWFRNYRKVQKEYKDVIAQGKKTLEEINTWKKSKAGNISEKINHLKGRILTLQTITQTINEGRLIRDHLTRAEIKIKEAENFLSNERYENTEQRLMSANENVKVAEEKVFSILQRYTDSEYLTRWKSWAEETITESKNLKTTAIVVAKLEKKLMVYEEGILKARYEIGLGRYGLSDKIHDGDEATPEGKYRIIKKNSSSRFYKALLLNYPTEEDRQKFFDARKSGLVPRLTKIGGMIEIHGGGKDTLTEGCISLDNEAMDELFSLVSVGTLVAIVGTLEKGNHILSLIRNFK